MSIALPASLQQMFRVGAEPAEGRVRLRTLTLLRWMAVAGQTGAVLFVAYGLGFELPMAPALSVVALSGALNIVLMTTRSSQSLVREWEAASQLAYDLLQLAVLLALTGGIQNPFVFLFVAPLAVSASVLRPAVTAGLAALAFALIGALALWRQPLPWPEGDAFHLPALYQVGMAASLLICLAFTSVYAWRVAAEEERLNLAVAAAEAVLAREQRLSALGGLAAAAAHELGTPLATIHLAAKEMARELPPDSPFHEDVQLLVAQSERCRAILTQLSNRSEEGDKVHAQAPLKALLEQVVVSHSDLGTEIAVTVEGGDGSPAPVVRRLPEIIHGLGAIVENAVGFADSKVEVVARWTGAEIVVAVLDNGPGFAPSILPRLGEPYVSERSGGEAGGGLGLGFFIAKTLLERSGGRVTTRNRTPPAKGAIVRVTWDRAAIEAEPL